MPLSLSFPTSYLLLKPALSRQSRRRISTQRKPNRPDFLDSQYIQVILSSRRVFRCWPFTQCPFSVCLIGQTFFRPNLVRGKSARVISWRSSEPPGPLGALRDIVKVKVNKKEISQIIQIIVFTTSFSFLIYSFPFYSFLFLSIPFYSFLFLWKAMSYFI